MRNLPIGPLDAGQRLDKYLLRYFKEADKGFLYRMLRKKNITLNGAKAAGSEKLAEGDTVNVFFSEETFAKMTGEAVDSGRREAGPAAGAAARPAGKPLDIVFENAHVLIVNKPAGLLTQKAAAGDDSLTDRIAAYAGAQAGPASSGFTPSAANRLDRNTSGLVLAGKTLPGQQLLSYLLRSRLTEKYYVCLAKGRVEEAFTSTLYWRKEEEENRALISERPEEGARPIILRAEPLAHLAGGADLLRVQLISGKSHQIRAQLAYLGHPILGDGKYGDAAFTRDIARRTGLDLRLQLLHSRKVVFPPAAAEESLSETARALWQELAGRQFTAPYPAYFRRVLEALGGGHGE
ncbi:MAG: RluA family pseudouridine synthase [Lachnospiraceae bacterium]|nr:RluA family pseudouridine synthase [Lachnospiraceae bacterium]